jgi:hypothetical protein
MYDFNLSCLPFDSGVSRRFHCNTTRAVTFAEDASCRGVLNSVLVLREFIISGDENWSFPRLGTDCLEGFFRLVCQSSHNNDRFTCAVEVNARTTVMVGVMRDLSIHSDIQGRNTMRGTRIG